MRAGPKPQASTRALVERGLPAGGGARVAAWCEQFLLVPKGTGAREPFVMRPWQRALVDGVFDDPRPRLALWSLARGQGKSTLSAALGLYGLHGDGVEGAQVVVVATDERQARHVFGAALRMTETSPKLALRTQVYADRLVVPRTGSTFSVLPAEAHRLEGLDPSLAIIDEIGVVDRRVYEVVALASGKRDRSLTLMIGTPAPNREESPMWDLVRHGHEHPDDATFRLVEYAAPEGCAVDDESAWAAANPGLDDLVHRDALRALLPPKTREETFRRARLGQWVGAVGAWLPWGAWDRCADASREVGADEPVVLFFDGSASGDSTALVGCTVGPAPHVFVVALFENPGEDAWRVPRGEVDAAVDDAFERYTVVEMACDPWGWRSEVEAWSQRHGERRVVEWNTAAAARMGPACDRTYTAVVEQTVTHDGSERLAAHVSHCVGKHTPHGVVVTKDRRMSTRKIDAAVGAIGAVERAAFHARTTKRRRRVVAW